MSTTENTVNNTEPYASSFNYLCNPFEIGPTIHPNHSKCYRPPLTQYWRQPSILFPALLMANFICSSVYWPVTNNQYNAYRIAITGPESWWLLSMITVISNHKTEVMSLKLNILTNIRSDLDFWVERKACEDLWPETAVANEWRKPLTRLRMCMRSCSWKNNKNAWKRRSLLNEDGNK